jgi:hypothetical protein
MYAKIVNNKIEELDAKNHAGESGWVDVSDSDRDSGVTLVYDTDTSAVRAKTAAEITAETDALVLADAWSHLRGQRNGFLRDTDEYTVSDRPATTNMPEYRAYLRDLPATYDDTSVLGTHVVMEFDSYVESL